MRRRIARQRLPSFSLTSLPLGKKLLLWHVATISFLVFGDGIVAYSLPITLERFTSNLFLVGLIMGFSSLVGLATDFLLAEYFPHKKYLFFAVLAFKLSLVFGLAMVFLPHSVPVFILAVGIWGVYYELTQFAHFNVVRQFVQAKDHALAWGWIEAGRAVTYIIAPLIASWLLSQHTHFPFYTSLLLFSVGFIIFRIIKRKFEIVHGKKGVPALHHSFKQELRIWRILLRRVWHLYLFYFVLVLLDMSFWTIGVLLSEELKTTTALGAILLPVYIAPTLISPLFSQQLAKKFSKKRIAFYSALLGSSVLTLSFLLLSGVHLILGVLIGSIGIAVSWPQTYAVFEDYVDRLGLFGEDMVGLERSAANLAAIIGPIAAGTLAMLTTTQTAMGIFSLLVLFMCIISLQVVPKKIKMPQTEINSSN